MLLVVVLLVVGFAKSDLSKDREECADKLIDLASCVPYVGGEAKTPTIDCCSGLKMVLEKSKKCICILIKDRDDPNLGIKINATLAIQLPTACHAPANNITQCVGNEMLLICFIYKYQYTTVAWLADIISYHIIQIFCI